VSLPACDALGQLGCERWIWRSMQAIVFVERVFSERCMKYLTIFLDLLALAFARCLTRDFSTTVPVEVRL